ncbi:long-chain-fatty-acid--CoA ligase ACSBG2-like isoform X2 [Pecten maximus]|uniref:long-chain-fatty-acid--CoA ligase ACSBG2-like isoform X2 n=1 Tax=Pecten maximus TaxID=6579 RepID=UPI001458EEF4|nr:long-chain-fatty-acid--CoA ligase ACSBG2-like isoform X2 [Pecten maximus]
MMEISALNSGPVESDLPQKTGPPQNGTTQRGRDTPVPATNLWTTKRFEPVKLRMGTGRGYDTQPPMTVPSAFERTVQKMPNQPALGVKRGGQWKKWTYQQYYSDVQRAAKSFIKLGLQPFHGVGILGFNAPEWHISYMGSIYAGGLGTGIYTTNTAEACQYVLEDSQSNIAVVENNAQLQKIVAVWDNLPHLKAIIQYTGEVAVRRPNIYTWDEFMNLSRGESDSVVIERVRNLAPNYCCTLVYTSGTTGNPKGVMQSHDSLTFLCGSGMSVYNLRVGEEVVVSYLPLSHSAGMILDIHMPYYTGTTVYFAQPDALKGTLKNTLVECRPTIFLGVPRVWEKFAEKMQEAARSVSGIKKTIGVKAKKLGLKGVYASMRHQHKPRGWSVAQTLLFKKVKKSLGLDRCQLYITGAAPITKETIEYFYCFNINILSVYGMSESTGPHTSEMPENFRIGSVGRDIPGVTTKLMEAETPEKDGSGEVCMWGRNVLLLLKVCMWGRNVLLLLKVCMWGRNVLLLLKVCMWGRNVLLLLKVCMWGRNVLLLLKVCMWGLNVLLLLKVCMWGYNILLLLKVCMWGRNVLLLLKVCMWGRNVLLLLKVCMWGRNVLLHLKVCMWGRNILLLLKVCMWGRNVLLHLKVCMWGRNILLLLKVCMWGRNVLLLLKVCMWGRNVLLLLKVCM